METTNRNTPLRIYINPDRNTPLEVTQWPINLYPEEFGTEPERVDVSKNGVSYGLVFNDDKTVTLEIRSVNEKGDFISKYVTELKNLEMLADDGQIPF